MASAKLHIKKELRGPILDLGGGGEGLALAFDGIGAEGDIG